MPTPKRTKIEDGLPPNTDHDKTCLLHGDAYNTKTICNGKKVDGSRCARSANHVQPGYLPTCPQHRDQKPIEGHCQAIAKCGNKCLRSFAWVPPHFQLCPKHVDYAMPCKFLDMPSELRLMVFECLLPAGKISAKSGLPETWRSILLVNKQLSEEILRMLHGTIPHELVIGPDHIQYAGITWSRFNYCGPRFPNPYVSTKIQSFQVVIICPKNRDWLHTPRKGENVVLFKVRDNVWRIMEHLGRLPQIRELLVSIRFGWPEWDVDEIAAASKFLLYPFKALRRVQTPRVAGIFSCALPQDVCTAFPNTGSRSNAFQQGWGSSEPVLGHSASSESRRHVRGQLVAVHEDFVKYEQRWRDLLSGSEQVSLANGNYQLYLEIEEFTIDLIAASICGQGAHPSDGRYPDHSLQRLLHRARIAQETQDLEALRTIRHRLVRVYKTYRAQLSNHFTAKYPRMLGHTTDWTTPIATQSIGVKPPQVQTQNWPDPPPEQVIPDLATAGVTSWTDEDDIAFIKTVEKTFIRYRTPAVVRKQAGRA